MSNESEQKDSSVEEQVLDLYRSVDTSRRTEDEYLLAKAIEEGLTPSSMRYGVMRDVYRGALRDLNGNSYYFNLNGDNFRVSKADTTTKQWEVDKMFKMCQLGADLVKGDYDVPEEEEVEEEEVEVEKADGGGGKDPSLPPPAIDDEENVAAQSDLITDDHPGGISGGATPDLPYQGRQWHPDDPAGQQTAAQANQVEKAWDYKDLLSSLGDVMKAQPGAPTSKPHVSEHEKRFMVTELGRTPQEVDSGNSYLTPIQRKLYNQWANKSLQTTVNSLEGWRNKNG